MHTFCGLDFGTSNTTIGTFLGKGCQLIPLEQGKISMRSAIFCDAENKQWVFGQEGVDRYLESIPGRLMMSLKSVLGSSLMDEETLIFNDFISYTKILGKYIQYIKQRAEHASGCTLTHVVMGRPVHFHDTDAKADQAAQNTLEKIARDTGFKEVSFQYEPIAAALAYESTLKREQLALIIDMGGGTSDFSVIRLRPGSTLDNRSEDVLANAGIHIAGTDFDQKLSLHSVMPLLGMGSQMRGSSCDIQVPSYYYHDLTSWHMLAQLYNTKIINRVRAIEADSHDPVAIGRLLRVLEQRAGHHILNAVELGKQQLSHEDQTIIPLEFIEPELNISVTKAEFNQVIHEQIESIIATAMQTINFAGIKQNDISAIFYTGGSTKIPVIHERINPLFPNAEIVYGDVFGSVGLGLTIDAEIKYR